MIGAAPHRRHGRLQAGGARRSPPSPSRRAAGCLDRLRHRRRRRPRSRFRRALLQLRVAGADRRSPPFAAEARGPARPAARRCDWRSWPRRRTLPAAARSDRRCWCRPTRSIRGSSRCGARLLPSLGCDHSHRPKRTFVNCREQATASTTINSPSTRSRRPPWPGIRRARVLDAEPPLHPGFGQIAGLRDADPAPLRAPPGRAVARWPRRRRPPSLATPPRPGRRPIRTRSCSG